MEAPDKPFKPGVIQPGMERVIRAGDTLVITDANGQEFAVTAREGEATMAFLEAFDVYLAVLRADPQLEPPKYLWHAIETTFSQLPLSLQINLPSYGKIGVIR